VLPITARTAWSIGCQQIQFSLKGYATRKTFEHFLQSLSEDITGKIVFLDQDQYRRSVLHGRRSRFQLLLLPVGTTRHSQPIDQVIHRRLKTKFKDKDFPTTSVSLTEFVTGIETELTNGSESHDLYRSVILAGWRIVRRKFPTGSQITRVLPHRHHHHHHQTDGYPSSCNESNQSDLRRS
jgi:hypothetical protein